MKKLFTLIFVLACFNAFSQYVTITATNQVPSVGDSIKYFNLGDFGFNPAGTGTVMDKTWDFSGQPEQDSLYFSYIAPSTTTATDSFLTSAIAEVITGISGYMYFQTGVGFMARKGTDDASLYMNYYTDSAMCFTFPITAGDQTSYTYAGKLVDKGTSQWMDIVNGEVEIEAVAQGTLITPKGTFADVLCIAITETFDMQVDFAGTPMVVADVEDEFYYWFHEDYLHPIFVSGTTTTTDHLGGGTSDIDALRYQPVNPPPGSGIVDNGGEIVEIYPNPTNGKISINANEYDKLTVLNLLGETVLSYDLQATFLEIDLSAQKNGIYFLHFENEKESFTKRIILSK
jgi:Secretion system C-terminal sorting domain